VTERRAITVDELELAKPAAYVPPEAGAGTFGKPDEDAWNRWVAQFVRLQAHGERLELREVATETEAAWRASFPDDEHADLVAFRETTRDLDRFIARREFAHEREVPALQRAPAATGEALILTARKSAKSCQNRPVLTKCGCGAKLVDSGCERTSCVRCAPRVTADRARRVVWKLEKTLLKQREGIKQRTGRAHSPAMFAFRVSVFTMPPSERERFTRPADWTTLRRKLWHLLRDEFGAAWACITTHPVGDENPTVFHPHLNVLWGKAGLAPGKMPPAELERLKARWADLLDVEGPVSVHGSFVRLTDEKQLRHRARYYCRVFVGWKFWMPKAVQWFGEYVTAEDLVVVCPCCKQQFVILSMGAEAAQMYQRLLRVAQQRGQAPPDSGAGALFDRGQGACGGVASWNAQARA
jgi:hypothetical protein